MRRLERGGELREQGLHAHVLVERILDACVVRVQLSSSLVAVKDKIVR